LPHCWITSKRWQRSDLQKQKGRVRNGRALEEEVQENLVVGLDRPHSRLQGGGRVGRAQGLGRGQGFNVAVQEQVVHHAVMEILQGDEAAGLVEVFVRGIDDVSVIAAGDVGRSRAFGEHDRVCRVLDHASADSRLVAGIRYASTDGVSGVPLR